MSTDQNELTTLSDEDILVSCVIIKFVGYVQPMTR